MSAVAYVYDLDVVPYQRLAVIAVVGEFGKRQDRVQRRYRPRGRLQLGYSLQHIEFQLFVKRIFKLYRAAFGIEYLFLYLFEIFGYESLARRQRLFAHVTYGNFIEIALADLYIIPENFVEAYFEILDTRFGALVAFQFASQFSRPSLRCGIRPGSSLYPLLI